MFSTRKCLILCSSVMILGRTFLQTNQTAAALHNTNTRLNRLIHQQKASAPFCTVAFSSYLAVTEFTFPICFQCFIRIYPSVMSVFPLKYFLLEFQVIVSFSEASQKLDLLLKSYY